MDGVAGTPRTISTAELGLFAHVYPGEVYRFTVCRPRLDRITNRSVVTLGMVLSIIVAAPDASALPLILVGVLILLFLALEARRYRCIDIWCARIHRVDHHLVGQVRRKDTPDFKWRRVLAEEYRDPEDYVSFLTALSRRVRSSYLRTLQVQSMADLGKLVVHLPALVSVEEVVDRAALGPLLELAVLSLGALYVAT